MLLVDIVLIELCMHIPLQVPNLIEFGSLKLKAVINLVHIGHAEIGLI
jgi:hypothetical protein